ncbi:polyprenyl synthetase family protein [Nakamurella lactea]|uniref:polyprenyl synthetase family protein n=1 Tax=Nakamurella lactea TaxID=459515 RepID=UPI000425903B|nr:polyprenyl synthetase family protein [Nakamurella lactea]
MTSEVLHADLLPAVDTALSEFLSARRAELAQMDPRIATAADRIGEFLAGGKRIRPAFCWWGWRAGGGRDEVDDCAPVVRVAAALELIQACALLHDDLIDRSETRRGRPAVHRAEAKAHADAGWSGDPDHFGANIALLFGDLALAWADDLFVTGAAALQAIDRAQPVWHAMRTEVLAGQLLDVLTSAAPAAEADLQRSDAFAVIRLKTAGYTVVRPLLLGAALAGADASVTGRLRRYGEAVGTAFQLRDDLLGVFGDPLVTGKPAGDDLAEGKRTVLLALARQQLLASGRDAELAELDAGIGSGPAGHTVDPAAVDQLRTIIASTAAADLLERQILQLVADGTAELAGLPEPVAEGLTAFATAATRRRS